MGGWAARMEALRLLLLLLRRHESLGGTAAPKRSEKSNPVLHERGRQLSELGQKKLKSTGEGLNTLCEGCHTKNPQRQPVYLKCTSAGPEACLAVLKSCLTDTHKAIFACFVIFSNETNANLEIALLNRSQSWKLLSNL